MATSGEKKLTKAIQEFCIDCMGGRKREVENCSNIDCSLFDYRSPIKEGEKAKIGQKLKSKIKKL